SDDACHPADVAARPRLLSLVAGRPAPLLAPRNFRLVAEKEFTARVDGEPLFEDRNEKRRERHPPRRALLLVPLLLVDEDGAAVQVEVLEPHAKDLGTPRPGVSGKACHRIDPGVGCLLLDEVEELLDLGEREEQALPELLLRFGGELAGFHLPLDLLPGLKRR